MVITVQLCKGGKKDQSINLCHRSQAGFSDQLLSFSALLDFIVGPNYLPTESNPPLVRVTLEVGQSTAAFQQ